MKGKHVKAVLSILLCMLIVELGLQKFGTIQKEESTDTEETMSVDVIRMMSEMENSIASGEQEKSSEDTNSIIEGTSNYEEEVEALCRQNETTSCSESYLSEDNLEDTADTKNIEDTEDAEEVAGATSSQTDSLTLDQATEDKMPSYSELYPDMYVDQITPCEHCDNVEKKIAYLTFDDGPSSNTLKVLEVLREKKAVATFFVLGSTMTEDGEQALKEMVDMGCAIGIHTYCHQYKVIYSSVEGFLKDFNEVYEQIYDITGIHPNIYRFPWGSYNGYSKHIKAALIEEMSRRGFTYYDWNVSAEDSVGTPSEWSITNNIMKDVTKYNYPVILMHDSEINGLTAQTLPSIIDKLSELGYEFDTLDHRDPCQFHW